jgi:two-component system chemotaxis response regulator CheB
MSGSGTPLVVIAASAGGVEAVGRLMRGLPADLPAAVFVAMHFPPRATSVLPEILTRAGPLPAAHATDGERIASGRVYVAPPGHHLLIGREQLKLRKEPHVQISRPSADAMFESAASAHGPRVIGVVLTGNLNDGTAGLQAIQRQGGITVVQDPKSASFPSMPTSAVEHMHVDYVLPLEKIPALIERLVRREGKSDRAGIATAYPEGSGRTIF